MTPHTTASDIAAASPDRVRTGSVSSGVSWGAILAGAVGAASLSLILVLLGAGLGFSSISPWAHEGASAKAIGIASILWITFTQIAASGMGGYLAGRLRTKWADIQADEVYFRDTAHGFLAWGVSTLLTAAVLTSAIGGIIGTGAQSAASLAGGAATAASVAGAAGAATSGPAAPGEGPSSVGYYVDSLFRKDASGAAAPASAATQAPSHPDAADRGGNAATASEVGRIFVNSLRAGALPPEDAKYVAQLVAQRTGLSAPDAEKRVNELYSKAQTALKEAETKVRDAADQARKTSAYATLWLFISLLIGAFVASFAATYGGRRRDF